MRINEDFLDNISTDEITPDTHNELEQNKDYHDYDFYLEVNGTQIDKEHKDIYLKRISNILDKIPGINSHAENSYMNKDGEADYFIGIEHNISTPKEVFRFLTIIDKTLCSTKPHKSCITATMKNVGSGYIKYFTMFREYQERHLKIGITHFSMFYFMVMTFNGFEKDMLKVCSDFVGFDFGEEMKDMYKQMTDKNFEKIDKSGKMHLSELNKVAHINNTEYQLFFQEISTGNPNMFRLQNVVEYLIDQHKHINKNGYINVEQVWIHEPEDIIMPAKLLLFLGNYYEESYNNTGFLLEYENEDREVI